MLGVVPELFGHRLANDSRQVEPEWPVLGPSRATATPIARIGPRSGLTSLERSDSLRRTDMTGLTQQTSLD